MKRAFVSAAVLSTAFVGSMACSDSQSSGPPPGANDAGSHVSGPPVSGTVGASGGTISAAGATLHVPAGALDHDVSIVVTPLANDAPQGYVAHSAMYRFEPEGLQFHVPAEIEMKVDGAGAQDKIFWTEPDGHFVGLPSTPSGGTLHANVAHFSRGFAGTVASSDLDAGSSDGAIDAGPACTTTPRADLLQAKVVDHAITWNGDGYGVIWGGTDSVSGTYFARLDAQGKKIGDPVRIANYSFGLKIVWNGSGYGVLAEVDGGTALLRLDPAGNVLGNPFAFTTSSNIYDDDLTFNGSQYGITWQELRGNDTDILFVRADANGQKLGSELMVRDLQIAASGPSITVAGDGYGIAWSDARISSNAEIYFRRVSTDGAALGAEVRVTNDSQSSFHPRIVWSGTQYGIFYGQSTSAAPQARFVRLDVNGQKVGNDILVAENGNTSDGTLDATWSGTGYGLVFPQSDGIGLYRVSADGSTVAPRTLLGAGKKPTLAWSGTGYRTIWYVPNGQYDDLLISPALCP